MAMKQLFEIVLIVDANGDYAVGIDFDDANEDYENAVGGGTARRVIKINMMVTLPEDVEINLDVADTAGDTVSAEAV